MKHSPRDKSEISQMLFHIVRSPDLSDHQLIAGSAKRKWKHIDTPFLFILPSVCAEQFDSRFVQKIDLLTRNYVYSIFISVY